MRVDHLVLDIYFRCNRHVYICSYIAVQEKHLIVLNHVHCVLVVTKVLKISSILLCFFQISHRKFENSTSNLFVSP